MKKNALILTIIGFAIQCFGLGFLLYGASNNDKFTSTGYGIMFLGLVIIGIGLIITGLKKIKKE
jgi:membrane protein DedA with SNARE-associated domain|tara:strand:+ start:387 stop:578 length:192 start_codon:yes stop_codon:yes gene_type:complete